LCERPILSWGSSLNTAPKTPLALGDIADRDRLRTVIEHYRPAAVMHFAGFAYVGESVENPLMYYRNNVVGTTVLLETLVNLMPIPFIFSSSCVTYGIPKKLPIIEDHPQRPINPYGSSKLFVERILADIGRACGLPWVSLRYFNASGADPSREIGEVHDPEPHLIPSILAAARDGKAVSINGIDYDTPDGTCVRDYVHVLDIADAHLRALDYLLAKGESCSLNLANSQGHSVKEVIAAAERVCGCAIPANVAPRRPGDPAILIGAADRARNLLGWVPTRSDIEIQIADAWNWMRSQRLFREQA
jgi:UDP-glucose-4-epimerase GalE